MKTQPESKVAAPAHTPGPWTLVTVPVQSTEFGMTQRHEVRRTDGRYIAHIRVSENLPYGITHKDRGAVKEWQHHNLADPSHSAEDARLIASAPELLAALEMVTEYAMRLDLERNGHQMNAPDCVQAARAAIAKAKGVQS